VDLFVAWRWRPADLLMEAVVHRDGALDEVTAAAATGREELYAAVDRLAEETDHTFPLEYPWPQAGRPAALLAAIDRRHVVLRRDGLDAGDPPIAGWEGYTRGKVRRVPYTDWWVAACGADVPPRALPGFHASRPDATGAVYAELEARRRGLWDWLAAHSDPVLAVLSAFARTSSPDELEPLVHPTAWTEMDRPAAYWTYGADDRCLGTTRDSSHALVAYAA